MAKLLTISISEQGSENVTAVSVEIDDDALKLPEAEFTAKFLKPAIGTLLGRFPGNYVEAMLAAMKEQFQSQGSSAFAGKHSGQLP